ncbi:MAG: transporter substrate-binding domain-containing protein [Burkholderiales bacterium]|nr:transporter substrate-binding domain-containing protein [Burkholderiales bacterium]
MDLACTGSAEGAARRRLLVATLLGLTTRHSLAMETLLVTAVNRNGGSAVAARLLAEIYRRAGLGLQVEVLPAPRASLMALSDKADGELIRIASYGQTYPQLIRVDPAYYRVNVRGYSLPGRNASVQSRDDLKHYAVGSIRGMAYVQELTENHPALTLTQNPQQLFRMLAAGRLDVALCTTLAAQSALNTLGMKDLAVSPDLARFELHHYLHVRRKELVPLIADVVRRMKDSGELEQLTLQYEAAAVREATQPAQTSST